MKGVHNDYTETSAPRRLREIVGDAEAERRFKKRWAIIQVWRPIRGTVLIDPLGICDGRTIPQKGFILVQRRYKYRTGEVYHIAHNPEHVWYYFPQMERDEALVFKVFDTDAEHADALHRALARSTIPTRRRTRRRAKASRPGRSRSSTRGQTDTSARTRWQITPIQSQLFRLRHQRESSPQTIRSLSRPEWWDGKSARWVTCSVWPTSE